MSDKVHIALVVAVAENGVIGRNGKLPWKLSSDLKWFRKVTQGKPVIMGRKTYDSLRRPLPGRTNIVITRDADYRANGAIVTIDKQRWPSATPWWSTSARASTCSPR